MGARIGRALGLLSTGSRCTVVVHAANIPTIEAIVSTRKGQKFMGLILLEALLALVILVAIVWWTMFAGRPAGELPEAPDDERTPPPGD